VVSGKNSIFATRYLLNRLLIFTYTNNITFFKTMKKMKRLNVKRTTGKILAFLIGMWLLGTQAAKAENGKWLLVTNDGTKLEMESVGSLVLADDAEAFDVQSTSGTLLAAKVKKVTFELQQEADAIKPLDAQGKTQLLSFAVDRQLTILGTQSEATVYSAAGIAVAKGVPQNGQTAINVSGLPQGTYMVRVGKQTFKFIKK
jgi:hypothetical protein